MSGITKMLSIIAIFLVVVGAVGLAIYVNKKPFTRIIF